MAEKKNSPSQLAKTQKIPTFETRLFAPGIHDEKARKLIEDYEKIFSVLKLVRRYNPVNPLIFILIKKKLSSLVQQEFELYKSFPELVKEKKLRGSAGIVSPGLQRELTRASKGVSFRLDDLIRDRLLRRKYMQEVYSFRLPLIKIPSKSKKFNSVFTSSAMKKKFS